jgi:biopolymer transport protein TolR
MSFGRLERSAGPAPMSEINMTPLIDVMLVLLVIFIITAPLMSSSLKLDLPRSDAAQPGSAPQFIAVALSPAGELYFGEERLDRAAFEQRVEAAAKANRELEVQLRADQSVAYGRVAELIGLLQKHGLERIAFVAEPASR